VVDTIGLLLVVMVIAASVQDRDGGRGMLKRLHSALSSVGHSKMAASLAASHRPVAHPPVPFGTASSTSPSLNPA
jgi:hypothetical protein